MATIAKIFTTGRIQAVHLPRAFRFSERAVYIRRDPASGDVILSRRPDGWDDFFAAIEGGAVPDDFLTDRDRVEQRRDPFEGVR